MPRLFVVPTPIGNLEDVTLRALRVLGEVGLIFAEDTRHTRKLLTHYGISTPLQSYHQHNKRVRLDAALQALQEKDAALVSSAGMPSVSDPGFELIEAAIQSGIEVDVLPGPSAVVTAVVLAALPAPGFLFVGFLPRRPGDRLRRLEALSSIQYSLVVYEAPHRLLPTLRGLRSALGDRRMAAVREMTKIHQEVVRGTVTEVIERFQREEARGEFTLVIAGAAPQTENRTHEVLEALRRHHREGSDARTAVAEVAGAFGVSRNEAYRLWLETIGESHAP